MYYSFSEIQFTYYICSNSYNTKIKYSINLMRIDNLINNKIAHYKVTGCRLILFIESVQLKVEA
jgi:hypothetical protein